MMSEVFMKFGSSIIFILLPFMFPLLVISLEYRHFFKSSPQPDIYYAIKTEDTQLLKKVLNQNNSYDDDINKALFNVMRSSHYTNKSQELEFLIKHGADVNKKNNGDTLVIALLHTEDNPDILKMLIDAGADVTITDNRNQTPLIVAYNYGRTKSIALLKSYKTEKNEYNETDLYEAAITENIENIKKITSYGISPNTKKINEKSPLATIIDIGDKPKVVQALLDVGADPRDMGYMGTPLMVTYIFGRKKSYDILKEYVSKTKDKNYKPQKSDLLEAATFGTPSEITKIVQSGVPVNFVINNSKETPLMYAAEYNPDPKVIEALIAAGADINAKTDMGYTAYYYARSSSKEIKNELLKAGANPDDVNIGRF
ncbi:MAG: ankyrin repeat domain-containing protein [Alphaproteobacteria bacterium]